MIEIPGGYRGRGASPRRTFHLRSMQKKESMPLLVFWPRAGAFGASAMLPPCTQLLWCELYDMKGKKIKINTHTQMSERRREEGEQASSERK